MPSIKPKDPRLLTDQDIDSDPFHCCGNEELVFLRCPACHHIMAFCSECDTLYPDLQDLTRQEPVSLTELKHRLTCPACRKSFDEYYFLRPPFVDKYLPTAEQVIAAGFGYLMSEERRREHGLTND